MLETLALDTALKKKDYKKRIKPLDTHLGEVQRELKTKGIPVLIVFEGWDTSGKGTAIGRLVQAFDPRGFDVYHVNPVSEQELYFPPMHRFGTRLPARRAKRRVHLRLFGPPTPAWAQWRTASLRAWAVRPVRPVRPVQLAQPVRPA